MSWGDGATTATNEYLNTQDTTGTNTFIQFDFNDWTDSTSAPFWMDSPPSMGVPCEDDRPLTKDSWYCPECEHLHGRRHYKLWDPLTQEPTEPDQPPYCPHCKKEFESWDDIEFLPQKEIDRINRERRWRDD